MDQKKASTVVRHDPRFQEISRERVSDRVARELLRLIAAGELLPGERLPGERQLAEMMNVSRVSVRAALQQLKAQGFVCAVQGGGTRVIAAGEELKSSLVRLVRADTRNLHDLMEIRANLEVWAARRAATEASEGQLLDIDRALQTMSDPNRPARCKAEDDHAFHLAIAKATNSAVYLHLMTVLGETLEKMFSFHRFALYSGPEDDALLLDHHRRIAAGISGRQPDTAADAMAEHLSFILARYRTAPALVPAAPAPLRHAVRR